MRFGPTAHSTRKILGGSQEYRKGVAHSKEGVALQNGVAKWCRAMIYSQEIPIKSSLKIAFVPM